VDGITGFKGVEVLSLVKVPEHGDSVLASRSAKRTVRRDGNSVDVSVVTVVVGPQLAVSKVPDLNNLVPTSGNNDGVSGVGGEANAGNPFGVSFVGDGEFAFSEGVPELDGLITRSRDDLSVVSRE